MSSRNRLAAAGLLALATTLGSAQAASVTVVSASATGAVKNGSGQSLAAALTDGNFGLGTWWTDAPNLWWTYQEGADGAVLTLTFDGLYALSDVRIGHDNNDFYAVQVSLDGTHWNTLLNSLGTLDPNGEYPGSSMLKRSSVAGDGVAYSSWIDFPVVQARYARVFALAGDQQYAVSELSFTGTAVPVPEPQAWAMLAAGLGVVGSLARRRRSR